jgi:Zn-dependent protease with chaperone function
MIGAYAVEYFEDREPIAFAKGGKVHVSSGMIARLDADEIAGVVLHETGHMARAHSLRKFLLNLAAVLVIFSVALIDFAEMWVRVPVILYAMLLWYWLNLRLNHWCEFDADAYAVKHGRGRPLARGLCKLTFDHREHDFEHPSVIERVLRIYEKA